MKNTVLCDPEYASGKGVKNTHPHVRYVSSEKHVHYASLQSQSFRCS